MPRKPSFDKSDLSWECAQVKRSLLNDVRKGRLTKLSKTDVLDLIAKRPRIGLKSSRVLWSGPHREYLEQWFRTLAEEVEALLNPKPGEAASVTTPEQIAEDNQQLEQKVGHLSQLVGQYRAALDQLRAENTRLRSLLTQRFGVIDSPDIVAALSQTSENPRVTPDGTLSMKKDLIVHGDIGHCRKT